LFESGTVKLPQLGIEYTVTDGKVTDVKNTSEQNLTVKLAGNKILPL
jgi:hypothetical protein